VFSSTFGTIMGGSFNNEQDTAAGRMLVSSDPPQQRNLRRAVHRAFAPDILDRVARQVTANVDAAIDKAIADGGCDFAADVARELPAGGLMGMMGLSHEDAHYLIELTHGTIDYRDPLLDKTETDGRLRLANVQSAIFEFFTDLIEDRRRNPREDLVSFLLEAEVNGRPMTDEEILYNSLNIAVGGNTTSVYSACEGLVELMNDPAQHRMLVEQPDLLSTAIEEILRWSTPNAYDHRYAMSDFEMGGKEIHEGDSVTLWLVSANRDEEQFTDPHRFDITRNPNRHLSFGFGIHRCIGNAFALTELQILWQRLIRDRLVFEAVGEIDRIRSNFMLGFRHLPVRVVGRLT
jgi:cytochrome P450